MNTTPLFLVGSGRFTLGRMYMRHAPELEALYRDHPQEVWHYSPQLSADFSKAPRHTVEQLIRDQLVAAWNGYNLSCGIRIDDRLVGQIDCVFDHETLTTIGIGYWIVADLQRQGIVSEACEHVISYCFNYRNVTSAWLHIAKDNMPSRRLAKKLRFQPAGRPLKVTDAYGSRSMRWYVRYAPTRR